MGVNAIALIWGFAEATLFFIVPDVWLTLAGRDKLHRGLIACLYSLTGALAGGTLMYLWGSQDHQTALRIVESVPAISTEMVGRVREQLSTQGVVALMLGPLSGTPYKLYAVQAAGAGTSIGLFLLVSVTARLTRFLLVTFVSNYALKGLTRWWPNLNRAGMLIIAWALFYAFYFSVMSG